MTSPNVVKVNDSNFEKEVLKATGPVLVDFYADWCPPCKNMAPHLDKYADENVGKVKVVKINVDDSGTTAQKFSIRSIPTLIAFKDGKLLAGSAGGRNKEMIEKFMNEALQKAGPDNINKGPADKGPKL
jgi:thioredoxin 1